MHRDSPVPSSPEESAAAAHVGPAPLELVAGDARELISELHGRVAAERLQSLAAALSEAASESEVGEVAMRAGVKALGAYAGVLAVVDEISQLLELKHAIGYPPQACMSVGTRWALSAGIPLAEAARTGAAVFIGSPKQWRERYGHYTAASGSVAWAAVPLGVTIGSRSILLWSFDRPRDFGPAEREMLLSVARFCAQALDRARLFEAERRARSDAEIANEAKARFLAVMSHELRTPLNAITGYSDLLDLGVYGGLTPEQRDAIQRIRRSGRHLLSLINDVLNFAKLQAGKVDVAREPVAIADVLPGLSPLVQPQLRCKELTLDIAAAGEMLAVLGDAEKIQQILLNLLANAIRFTPNGGTIELEARRAGSVVEIRCTDMGIGFSPESREAIFEPFVQLGRGFTSVGEGTGLGLAISRDLAQAMGGDLVADGTPGAGATFVLSLPAA